MAESKSGKLYKGFNYGNYCDRSEKWLNSIYDEKVEFVRTEGFTYQCNNPDRDYHNHLIIQSKKYPTPIETVLVVGGKRYEKI